MGKANRSSRRKESSDKLARIVAGVGTAAGTRTAIAVGTSIVAGAGTATGTCTALGVGNALASAVGTARGGGRSTDNERKQLLDIKKIIFGSTLSKPEPKSESKEKKPCPAVSRAIPILIELYPPTGIPPDTILRKTVRADVNKVITERNELLPTHRKEPVMEPDSVRRAILVLKERHAPP